MNMSPFQIEGMAHIKILSLQGEEQVKLKGQKSFQAGKILSLSGIYPSLLKGRKKLVCTGNLGVCQPRTHQIYGTTRIKISLLAECITE